MKKKKGKIKRKKRKEKKEINSSFHHEVEKELFRRILTPRAKPEV